MQACNAHSLHCVPLYDTLGAGAVKYIICHADISIIFVEETKIFEVVGKTSQFCFTLSLTRFMILAFVTF
ncbi:putative long-chain-fatty-acid--CoA ligase [Helianthus annuus]|nr:putative long-chain-fatty-acid--CoA ligase [Helianthus annuus]KAJ0905910.1 putative long-chain-fatty-acid--CoA ligase [Helianthus annuus]